MHEPYFIVILSHIYARHSNCKANCYKWLFYIAATVHFNQSSYSVNENNSPAQSVLVLSNPSSADITVTVFSTDESATGKYY